MILVRGKATRLEALGLAYYALAREVEVTFGHPLQFGEHEARRLPARPCPQTSDINPAGAHPSLFVRHPQEYTLLRYTTISFTIILFLSFVTSS
jgi:hypothetical protein